MSNPFAAAFLRQALLHPSFASLSEVTPAPREGEFFIDWDALLTNHCKVTPDVRVGSLLPLILIDAASALFMKRMPLLIHRLRMFRGWLYPDVHTLTPEALALTEDVEGVRIFHEVRCQIYRVLKVWKGSMVPALKHTFDDLIGSHYSEKATSLIKLQDILASPTASIPRVTIPYTPLKFSDAEELGALYRRERFGVVQADNNFFIVSHIGVVRQALLLNDSTPYTAGFDDKDTFRREERIADAFRSWLTSKVKYVSRKEAAESIFKRAGLKDRTYDPAQYTIVYRADIARFASKHQTTDTDILPAQPPPSKPRKVYERREVMFHALTTLWRNGLWVKASTLSVAGVSPREVLMFNEHKKQVTDPRECTEAFFRPVILMEREPALKAELEQLMIAFPDFKAWRSTFISNVYKAKRRDARRVFTLYEDTALLKYAEELRDSTAAWALLPASHTAEEYRRRLEFLSYVSTRFGFTIEQARDLDLVEKTLPTSMWIKHRKAARSI